MKKIWKQLFCFLGFHEWDGHTDSEYPHPRCNRCKKWYGGGPSFLHPAAGGKEDKE